ncbi:LacI family DNA-binding transcriptional regulator [Sphingobium sp. HBC34]|uniref:LacI family DNA-binding transcriptional regulator n=1 Tax=Sphingobium cyanobacteriorum TaxID=3063954 RepID=A0ABT8ZQ15_9SPHN|nr:LacI family DNA-binding transcriptional regulator [Sphingobium sp. HBC34]MDO7836627.1 LacI family DNA-binding transcriptional regulator [Sphingobium sp. HBC34]
MDTPGQKSGSGRATIEDVARMAGVSIKSVSRVVNGEPHVSQKLRDKVSAAIAALHYVPDMAARSLAGARAFIIGLLIDNPSPNYTIKVQRGVYRACVEQSYHMRLDHIDSTGTGDELERSLAAMLRNSRCDGFILTPPLADDTRVLESFERAKVRYVRIGPNIMLDRAQSVRMDDAGAAALVAQHLWDLGHRRFGLVTGPESLSAALMRRQGFLDKLAELGFEGQVPQAEGGFTVHGGVKAGERLLAGSARPSAIFATNDDSAVGTMVAALGAGLTVPRDLSVCGFDDSWMAQSAWPNLTTIYQPIEEMGYAAAQMLLDRSGNGPQVLTLPYRLIERDSAAPPAAHPTP